MFTNPSFRQLTGLISSGLVATGSVITGAVHPVVGTLPVWGVTMLEWTPLIGGPIGLAGLFYYARNMRLDGQIKNLELRLKDRQDRDEHRRELREIQSRAAEVAATVAATAVTAAKETVSIAALTASHVVDAASVTAHDILAECTRRQGSGDCPMQKVFVEHAIQIPKT